jgi:hypothetical protein
MFLIDLLGFPLSTSTPYLDFHSSLFSNCKFLYSSSSLLTMVIRLIFFLHCLARRCLFVRSLLEIYENPLGFHPMFQPMVFLLLGPMVL